ncbi:hypothetical protein HZB02_03580 [Candidatus Woesearchaeota archaeon]|nr:hypothetical protein [Candidatus Woesearchaeota archaeon]
MTDQNNRDIVLLCGPGAMQGVFSAGVLMTFEEANLYPRIKAGYGVSAGAMNLAYYFARQTAFGSSIYTEELIGRKFIRKEYLPIGIIERWVHKKVTALPLEWRATPINLDFLFDEIITQKKQLNMASLESALQEIDFKILLANPEKATTHYVEAKGETLQKLKASTAIVPYYNHSIMIEGCPYVDPSIIRPFGAEELIAQLQEEDKLVVISNFSFERGMRHHLMATLEAEVTSLMFEDELSTAVHHRFEQLDYELRLIQQFPGVTIIQPCSGQEIHPNETNQVRLKGMYNHGMEHGRKFLEKEREFKRDNQ